MFSLIKWIIILGILVASFTVPLGNKTLYGHVSSIWKSKEGKDLRDGVKTTYCDVKDKASMKLNNKSCPPTVNETPKPAIKKVSVKKKNRNQKK